MNTKLSMKPIKLIIFLLLAYPISALACAGYYGDDWGYHKSIVDENLLADPTLLYFVYQDDLSRMQNLPESHQNIDLWIEHLGRNVTYEDAEELVYNWSESDVRKLLSIVETNSSKTIAEAEMSKNTMASHLVSNSMLEETRYLLLAKQFSRLASDLLVDYRWNPDEAPANSDVKDMLEKATVALERSEKEFIRQRIFYQIVRVLSNARQYQKLLNLYDQYTQYVSIGDDLIGGWIHGHLGRAHFYLGDMKKAAYEFVKLYELAPEKYVPAAQSFLWTDMSFEDIVDVCQSTSEKRALAYICGTQKDSWEAQNIYRILLQNSDNAILEMIALNAFKRYEKEKNIPQLKTFFKSTELISQKVQASRQHFWKVLSAASATIAGMSNESKDIIQKWERKHYYTSRENNQWKVIKLVNAAVYDNTLDMERAALDILPVLSFDQDGGYGWAQYLSHEYILDAYKRRGDSVKMFAASLNSAYLRISPDKKFAKIERYGDIYWNGVNDYIQECSDDVLMDIVKFLATDDRNAFFKFYTGMMSEEVILDFLMSRAAGQLDWSKAMKYASKMTTNIQQKILVDPFVDFYNMNKYNNNAAQGEMGTMTKSEVIEQIRKAKLKADLGSAEAAYKYATALYNMSYYGNNWLLSRYAWSIYDNVDYIRESISSLKHFGDEYYELQEAEKYAQKAMSSQTLHDDAAFLASLCIQYRLSKDLDPYAYNYQYDFMLRSEDNPYFSDIDLQNTRIISLCSYFSRYVANKR